ncbi:MAG: hypothetical protein FJ395_17385 [Verrucomicrobia bacterium]|nr:hypothetical protein [Verrucomicrobiota bacterium]
MNNSRLEMLRAQREARRLRQRRRTKGLVLLFACGVILVVILIEIGRAFSVMQQVNRFVSTISLKSPDDVKEELNRLSGALIDRNPIVRQAPIVAFSLATGERFEEGAAWHQWWIENRDTWRYAPPGSPPAQGVVSPHPYKQAFPRKP